MYNFIVVGGTCLNRLHTLDSELCNIVDATSLDHFKEFVDKGYKVIIHGLHNNPNLEFKEYIDYLNQNNIPVIIDALYEANVMKFHHCHLTVPTTLLTANMLIKEHNSFDNVISVPYFLLQSYVLWTNEFKIEPVTYQEHINNNKKSFLCLNGVNKPGRRFTYDYLRQNNLLEEAIFSFTNRNSGVDILDKYPTIYLDDDIENNNDGVTWDNTFRKSWFLNTNFNLVTESSSSNESSSGPEPLQQFSNAFFPTEKTFKPIFNSHPFICIADKDYHKNLNEFLDIELYDEVFDYSFDKIEDHEQRWREVLHQCETTIDYTQIKDKLEHNQNLFLDYGKKKNILVDLLNQIDNVYN